MVTSVSRCVRITLNTGEKYIYKHIDDIKPEYYDRIIYLSCYNLDLTSLPQYYPNLEELYCVGNNLTEIPQYPKLKKLYCNNKSTCRNLLLVNPHFPMCQVHLVLMSRDSMNRFADTTSRRIPACRGWYLS
jgi:hypothetical protein